MYNCPWNMFQSVVSFPYKSNVVKLEPTSKNKTKSKEKSIEQIAEELMKKNRTIDSPQLVEVVTETPEEVDKRAAETTKKIDETVQPVLTPEDGK